MYKLRLPGRAGIRRRDAEQLHELDVVQLHGPVARGYREEELLRIKPNCTNGPRARLSCRDGRKRGAIRRSLHWFVRVMCHVPVVRLMCRRLSFLQ